MAKKYVWSIVLRPNPFTQDNDRDQLADVVPAAAKRDEDIADAIVAEGSEIKKETILNILSLRNKKVFEYALSGCTYSNEVGSLSPRVSGVFEDINSVIDTALHKCSFDIMPSASLRAETSKISVKVTGCKDSGGAVIGAVTNTLTGNKDGTVQIGDDVIIEGEKIKIQDEADTEQGVFFVDMEGNEHRVTRKLTANKPSRLIARVPSSVAEGNVSLIIRTRYTGSSVNILKNLRELRYAYELKAVKA